MGKLICVLFLSLLTAPSVAEDFSADVFDFEGKTKLFTFAGSRVTDKGVMTYSSEYKGLDSSVVIKEKATITKGVIDNYEIESLQSGEKGKIYVKGKKIYFEYTNEKKKRSKAKTKLQPNTLVSASLVPFLQENFSKILAKKDLNFKYAVWYRKELVSFRFVFYEEK